jgi:hypothetical protein
MRMTVLLLVLHLLQGKPLRIQKKESLNKGSDMAVIIITTNILAEDPFCLV